MSAPTELKYSKDHEWLKLSDDGESATVGITAFAQGELGDIVFVELEEDGSEFAEGEIFGTIEAVKTVSELFMPVGGTILEINADLDANPETVNSDPYGAGWMVKISIADPSQLESLMDAEAYLEMTGA